MEKHYLTIDEISKISGIDKYKTENIVNNLSIHTKVPLRMVTRQMLRRGKMTDVISSVKHVCIEEAIEYYSKPSNNIRTQESRNKNKKIFERILKKINKEKG